MRQYEAIDLMKLYTLGTSTKWNQMLRSCLERLDINTLAKTRYQLQAGMDDLAKQKLNTDDINLQYIRWIKSIEKTAKQIIRIKHPEPGDNPLIASKYPDRLSAKRARDFELMKFMKASSY